MYDIIELSRKLLPDLREIAKELDIKKIESFKKQDLIYKILDTQAILASEKKTDDKKLKSPRDIAPKKEESSVFKLFSRKKEEKPAENTEEKPAEKKEEEKPIVVADNEQKKEGKREFQIKKRPRTEHVKAGSSSHNPNQGGNAKQNINPSQRQNQNQYSNQNQHSNNDNNQKNTEHPKFNQNQNQKVRQELLFTDEPIESESLVIPTEPVEEMPIVVQQTEQKPEQHLEETKQEESLEKRNDNQNNDQSGIRFYRSWYKHIVSFNRFALLHFFCKPNTPKA